MATSIFQQYNKFGERRNGIPNTASFQTQTAIPFNVQTPYSQVENDDGNKPLSASDIKGGRYFDAVCAMDGTGDFNGGDSILEALNAGKKRIYVKAGTYPLTKQINIIGDNILIHGEDKNNTILKQTNTIKAHIQIGHTTIGTTGIVNNITIENLYFDGTINYGAYTIWGGSSNDIMIRDCMFNGAEITIDWDSNGAGDPSNRIRINNCSIISLNTGIEVFQNINNLIIENNYIKSSGYGIGLNYSTKVLIKNNYINNDLGGYGIDIAGTGARNNIVVNNIIKNGDNGINLRGDGYNIIANNILSNFNYWGINCEEDYDIIINNQISKCGQVSINYPDIQITGSHNIVANNQCTEIDAIKPTYNIADNGYVYDYNIVKNNICIGATTQGILITSANSIVKNNQEI